MKHGFRLLLDAAILTLDAASRRLAATPGHTADLSQAYLLNVRHP